MKPVALFFIIASTVVADTLPTLFTEQQWNETPIVCAQTLKTSLPLLFPKGECPPPELWTFIEGLPFSTNKNVIARQIGSKGEMFVCISNRSGWNHLETCRKSADFCGFCLTNEVESLDHEPGGYFVIGASPEMLQRIEQDREYFAEKSIRESCAAFRRVLTYYLTNSIPASIVSQYPPDVLSSNLQQIAISAKLNEEETAQMYRSLNLTPPKEKGGGEDGTGD